MNTNYDKTYVERLLARMAPMNASDLFVTVGAPPAMKIDGLMSVSEESPLTKAATQTIASSIMSERHRREFEELSEVNFAISVPGIGRFRANAFKQQGCVGLVFRSIPSDIPSFATINVPPALPDLALSKRGLIIFVGGTGTGKSTTLAALVNHRNENTRGHIITIEDPIEYIHPHKQCLITQREIGVDTASWEAALKNALRQAPDVILMGEIRDRASMEHALSFAETGHLCLATLHANNANQALDRIVNFFPEQRHRQLYADMSQNVRALVSQRLIPHISGSGRVAAIEILINSPLVSDLIAKGEVAAIKQVMKDSREQGMQTFDQHLLELFESTLISESDALGYADSANDLKLAIKLARSRNYDDSNPHKLSVLPVGG